ncbi:hypothetical protein C8R44DRAFT_992879 [Mycena epipterygia]|nr:hypothetical protein C8R44DRAFT_992879 [Mycena epipterygia]
MSSTSLASSATLSSLTTSGTASSSAGSSGKGPGPSLPLPPTPPPSGISSQCNDPQGCSAPPPATLYLYTFLSTLIILLLVSGGIIARSVVLRRRQQIAIENGTWASPRRRENYSTRPKPVMFDAYVAAEGFKEEQERWSNMKPWSVSELARPLPSHVVPPQPESQIPQPVPLRRNPRGQMRSIFLIHNPLRQPPIAPPPPAVELAPLPSQPEASQVRVAVFISMPSQDTEELPYLELGVLHADIVDHGKMSSESDGEGCGKERADAELQV